VNCPRCGAPSVEGASFCQSCGQSLAAPPTPPTMAPPPPMPMAGPPPPPAPMMQPPMPPGPAPASSALPVVAVVLVVLLILAVVGGLVAWWVLSSVPAPTVYGDCTAYYPSGPAYYTDVSYSDCQAFCDQIERNTGEIVTECAWVPR